MRGRVVVVERVEAVVVMLSIRMKSWVVVVGLVVVVVVVGDEVCIRVVATGGIGIRIR